MKKRIITCLLCLGLLLGTGAGAEGMPMRDAVLQLDHTLVAAQLYGQWHSLGEQGDLTVLNFLENGTLQAAYGFAQSSWIGVEEGFYQLENTKLICTMLAGCELDESENSRLNPRAQSTLGTFTISLSGADTLTMTADGKNSFFPGVSAGSSVVFTRSDEYDMQGIAGLLAGVPKRIPAWLNSSQVLFDGKVVAMDAYQINGYNYFKLRDLAYLLNGTQAQISVSWVEDLQTIQLGRGMYAPVGGELEAKGQAASQVAIANVKLTFLGDSVSMQAFEIDGNNYFKLRDVGRVVGFSVNWDAANDTVIIRTS